MLTDVAVKAAKPKSRPYKLSDRASMYLLIKPNGAKLWQYAFKLHGKEGTFSIGDYPRVSISEARKKQLWAREQVINGKHPTRVRQHELDQLALAAQAEKTNTLGAMWQAWEKKSSPRLAPKTKARRTREVNKDIPAKLLSRPIAAITRRDLVGLLDPIDERAPTVAQNIRQYLHGAFEHAINSGILSSNPVPPSSVLTSYKSTPHSALIGSRLGDFLHKLDAKISVELKTRTAMLLMLFTVLRKCEVTDARWKEIDLDRGEWLVPKERMKERADHWVPLSSQAIDLLRRWRMYAPEDSEFVFPNRRSLVRPMAGRTLNALMYRLGFGKEGTPHGMRSAFSTHFNRVSKDRDVIERCLSHGPADEVRAAYNRYEYEDERQAMLQDWADHLDKIRASSCERANHLQVPAS
jgi:integrase